MLRKSTNLLLTRTLSSCLQNLIKKPHIGLTEVVIDAITYSLCKAQFKNNLFCYVLQLVQIIINTTHLEHACKYLEDFITNITNVSPETVHTTRLYGLSTFKVKSFTDMFFNYTFHSVVLPPWAHSDLRTADWSSALKVKLSSTAWDRSRLGLHELHVELVLMPVC